jgi:hypothetical protein
VRKLGLAAAALSLLSLLMATPALAATRTAATTTRATTTNTNVQTCPVPILGIDPDSVTAVGPIFGDHVTGTITAAETKPEQGPNAPTTRIYVWRMNGANFLMDLLAGLMGPSTSGGASLSGPAMGKGVATETIHFSKPGTYVFGFLALFDSGIHPCTSLLPMNHTITMMVPS